MNNICIRVQEGDLPYTAAYTGFRGNLSSGVRASKHLGLHSDTYRGLVDSLIRDLKECGRRKIEIDFDVTVSDDLRGITKIVLNEIARRKAAEGEAFPRL